MGQLEAAVASVMERHPEIAVAYVLGSGRAAGESGAAAARVTFSSTMRLVKHDVEETP